MKTLLDNDFTAHYGLPVSTITNISLTTNDPYFEIEDDAQKETQLHTTVGSGMAAYSNTPRYAVEIINYDKFITNLPHAFQKGRKRCDLIVYTQTLPQYFLLNELKDRKPKGKVRTKAINQLIDSLTHLMAVSSIVTFIDNYHTKRCCFFNKQAVSPPIIKATSAFNRLNTITTNGLKMSNVTIEAFGFELYEYVGGQVLTML